MGDGECYDRVVPFERQMTVAKVDETGELEWMTNIGDIGFNYGKFGIELSDGTFLASGSIALPDPEGQSTTLPLYHRI